MKNKMKILALAGLFLAAPAFAVEKEKASEKKHPEVSAEQRKKMADAHEKMAACLRSDKSFEDCHKEMWAARKDIMGGDECPMRKHGGKSMGMKHHGMPQAPASEEKKNEEKK